MTRLAVLVAVLSLLATALTCGSAHSPSATPSPVTVPATRTTEASPSAALSPTPTTTPTAKRSGPAGQPLGFPIDPATRLGLVAGAPGTRTIEWGAGSDALSYTRDSQPSDDPDAANRSGWDCRVHVEYEGKPAVDWYIATGTPVLSTMDGVATLYAITTANGFDYYGIAPEPYLGNPDRSRAPLNPFPGFSGGLGVYVEIDSGEFLTTSAHLDLQRSVHVVPAAKFYPGYSADTDYESLFSSIPASRQGTPIAQWQVRRGDIIGYSGDAGYSEAPHLHYTVQRGGSNRLICPTTEAGFDDGGWLLK